MVPSPEMSKEAISPASLQWPTLISKAVLSIETYLLVVERSTEKEGDVSVRVMSSAEKVIPSKVTSSSLGMVTDRLKPGMGSAAGRAVAMAPRNTRAKVRATRAILIIVFFFYQQ